MGTALAAGADAVARCAQETQRAVAAVPFGVLRRIPLVSPVSRLVEEIYNGAAAVAYAGARRGSAVLLPVIAGALPARAGLVMRGVLNGTHGDTLVAMGSPVAASMALYAAGVPVPATPEGLRALAHPTGRVCVFIHGLCMDERAWEGPAGGPGAAYGERLREALGYTPLYVRYNTGLPAAENGRALAGLLQEMAEAYPEGLRDVALVGHSMGGLVAHYAYTAGMEAGLEWTGITRAVIALGSPFRGSPLARAGHVATKALRRFAVTAPLGALADTRSAGVKDLRLDHDAGRVDGAPYRFVSGGLRWEGPLGRVLGDGLVPPTSAAPVGLGAAAYAAGVGHLALLDDPGVYAQIERWLRVA